MQVMSPRWYIQNFDSKGTRMIHLSYHDGEHYNSIRSKEDSCSGPARPIVIKVHADLSAISRQEKANVAQSRVTSSTNVPDTAAVKIVMAGTGCDNADKVEQVLLELDGDIDAAIEFLTEAHGTEENLVKNNDLPCENGDHEHESYELHKVAPQCVSSEQDNANDILLHDDDSSEHDDKALGVNKIPRNKACPCGSKKKYKSCCGAGKRAPPVEFVMTEEASDNRGKKGRKQNKKGEPSKSLPSQGSKGDLLDLGALCI